MAPAPIEVFEDNIRDAERLIHLSRVLSNTRQRRMRAELRASFGAALKLPRKRHIDLDCVESEELFILIKPGASGQRDLYTEAELRPLLRQAVVAAAAAVETYVADKACRYIGTAIRAEEIPRRMRDMSVNFGEILDVDRWYQRKGWGYREIVKQHLTAQASSSPSQIGQVFSTVGEANILKRVDTHRKVKKGTSEAELAALTERRNRIAHAADRVGTGRAHIALDESSAHVRSARAFVEALEAVLP